MAFEYIVAGRRPLPRSRKVWSTSFASDDVGDEDDEDDDTSDGFDEGGCTIDEMRRSPKDYVDFVARRAGFTPTSIVAISPAAWDFSRAAAEVIAAALDGVYFCDAIDDDPPHAPFERADAPATLAELEERLADALHDPDRFFAAWDADAATAPRDPTAEKLRASENDWSDV